MAVTAGVLDAITVRRAGDLPGWLIIRGSQLAGAIHRTRAGLPRERRRTAATGAARRDELAQWQRACSALLHRCVADCERGALGQSRLALGGPAESDAWTLVDRYGPGEDRFVITRVDAAAHPAAHVRTGVIVSVSPDLGELGAQRFERTGSELSAAIGEPAWSVLSGAGSVALSACGELAPILADVASALALPRPRRTGELAGV